MHGWLDIALVPHKNVCYKIISSLYGPCPERVNSFYCLCASFFIYGTGNVVIKAHGSHTF